MKILHTADWHLGKVIYGRSMLEEQEWFLNNIFYKAVETADPDLILIAGDIFDRQIAPAPALRLFDGVLKTLCDDLCKKLVIITGNHDGADRLLVGAGLLKRSGVFLFSKLSCKPERVTLTDAFGDVDIYPLPFFDPAEARAVYRDDNIKGFFGAYERVLSEINRVKREDVRNVLAAHCFVSGGRVSDSETQFFVGGSGEVPASLFKGFDYVALGHLHAPQRFGEHIRYSGSPLKYSFDEANQKKALLQIEIGKKGTGIQVEELPIIPRHDMKVIRGSVKDLIERAKQNPCHDFVFAELVSGSPVFEPMAQLREHYPNILSLSNNWQAGGPEKRVTGQKIGRGISDSDVIKEFFAQICNQEISGEDLNIINGLLKELKEGDAL